MPQCRRTKESLINQLQKLEKLEYACVKIRSMSTQYEGQSNAYCTLITTNDLDGIL
jgi:hypothetical protein